MERPYPWEKSYPQGVDWQTEIPSTPVTDLLDEAVAAWPGNTCITFRRKRYRYRDIAALVDKAAKAAVTPLRDAIVNRLVRYGSAVRGHSARRP